MHRECNIKWNLSIYKANSIVVFYLFILTQSPIDLSDGNNAKKRNTDPSIEIQYDNVLRWDHTIVAMHQFYRIFIVLNRGPQYRNYANQILCSQTIALSYIKLVGVNWRETV